MSIHQLEYMHHKILKQLKESTVDCSLKEEQRLVRKAYDKIWAVIFKLSRERDYTFFYRNIYDTSVKNIEKLRNRGRNSRLGSSLMTCPEERPPQLFYESHCKCLEWRKWEIFHNQTRSEDPERRVTILLMCIETVDGKRMCRVEENYPEHAEKKALSFLGEVIPKKIDMYISRSPCKDPCLPELMKFIKYQGALIESFRIRFSSVHAHYDIYEMQLLRKLKADIGVFSQKDWDHVEKHLTDEAYSQIRGQFVEMNADKTDGARSETECTQTTSAEESVDNEKHYDTRGDYTNDINKNEARSTIIDTKIKYEDDDSDGITSNRYKKYHPIRDDCTDGCVDDCKDDCRNDCKDDCKNDCKDDCKNDCKNDCKDDCKNDCKDDCINDCKDDCKDDCKNDCKDDCKNDCKDDYKNDCKDDCKNDCKDDCKNDCKDDCINDCKDDCKCDCKDDCNDDYIDDFYDDSMADYYDESMADYFDDSMADYFDDSMADYYDKSMAAYFDDSMADYFDDSMAEYYYDSMNDYYESMADNYDDYTDEYINEKQ